MKLNSLMATVTAVLAGVAGLFAETASGRATWSIAAGVWLLVAQGMDR